jgi:lysophospholipid acyltransferase (LPLAT)-like uncharacterized protein
VKWRLSPGAARWLLAPLVLALCRTWRFEVVGREHWDRSRQGDRPVVYVMWHEALLPLLWHHRRRGVAIVVSEARDGQYLADLASRIGYRTIRGSTHRGAVRALVGAVRELRSGGSVAFTPDGPRGPRRSATPGYAIAAQKTGALVVPVHAEARWARRLASWDRFLLPLPFARVRVTFGEPFMVAPGEEGLRAGVARGRHGLEEVVERSAWRNAAAIGTG